LDDIPGEEIVIGVAGKFWRPDGGRCLDLTAEDFAEFSRAGYASPSYCTVISPVHPTTNEQPEFDIRF
jgi:hypothetical protein